MSKKKPGEKVFNIIFEEDLHMKLKIKSITEKTTMNELVVKAVKKLLEEEGKQ